MDDEKELSFSILRIRLSISISKRITQPRFSISCLSNDRLITARSRKSSSRRSCTRTTDQHAYATMLANTNTAAAIMMSGSSMLLITFFWRFCPLPEFRVPAIQSPRPHLQVNREKYNNRTRGTTDRQRQDEPRRLLNNLDGRKTDDRKRNDSKKAKKENSNRPLPFGNLGLGYVRFSFQAVDLFFSLPRRICG